ncbi:MAG: ABC transporter substrate-binding protein [Sulfurihydrogenibium sp.]|nr:ABC transporter substrate-binding protein [Sulfurihydrogenibium sp.]
MTIKSGISKPNKNTASNLQPLQDTPQPTSTSTIQNTSQDNSDVIKAGLIGAAAGLGAGLLLSRNNYYDYYNLYAKPDTSLADHLHDLIWNDECCKCDNDVIYNTFSSCDDTNFLGDSSCSWNDDSSCNSWDFNYDNNSYNDDNYSWNSWDSGDDSSW